MVDPTPTGPPPESAASPGVPPTPPPPVGRPELRLSSGDKWVAGVAGGLARTLGVPSWTVRLAFVVLTALGGVMVFAYLALWFFLPDESGRVIAREVTAGNESWLPVAGVVILALAFGATVGIFGSGDAGILVPAVLVAGGIALLAGRDRSRPAAPAAPPSGPAGGPAVDPTASVTSATAQIPTAGVTGPIAPSTPPPPPVTPATAGPPTTTFPVATPPLAGPSPAGPPPVGSPASPAASSLPPVPPPRIAPYEVVAPPPAPRPPKPPSFLTPLTLSVLAIAGGVAFLLDRAGEIDVRVDSLLAIALIAIGAVLLLATWVGRARGLIAVGLILLPVAALASVTLPFHKGLGQQRYAPLSTSEELVYEYGIGELTIDLRDLEHRGTADVRAELGIGSLVVIVPSDVDVDVHGEVGAGEIRLSEARELFGPFGRADDTTVRTESGLGAELDQTLEAETETARRIDLEAEVGMGEVVIRRDVASS